MKKNIDQQIVEKVLCLPPESIKAFMSRLDYETLGYLENILNKYEKDLDQT